MNDAILITIAGLTTALLIMLVAGINVVAYLKYYRLQGYPDSPDITDTDPGIFTSGIYWGVERRAKKRASRPVYHRGEEHLAFR